MAGVREKVELGQGPASLGWSVGELQQGVASLGCGGGTGSQPWWGPWAPCVVRGGMGILHGG